MHGRYLTCFALWLSVREGLASLSSGDRRARQSEHFHQPQFIADGSSTAVESPFLPLRAPAGPELGGLLRAAASDGVMFAKHHRILSLAVLLGMLLLAWNFKLSRDLDKALSGGDRDRSTLSDSGLYSIEHAEESLDRHTSNLKQPDGPGPLAGLLPAPLSPAPKLGTPQPPAGIASTPLSPNTLAVAQPFDSLPSERSPAPSIKLGTGQKALQLANQLPLQTQPAMAVSQQQGNRGSPKDFPAPELTWPRGILNTGDNVSRQGILGIQPLRSVNFMANIAAPILERILPSFWEKPEDEIDFKWELVWTGKRK